jgi:hypothetical protein
MAYFVRVGSISKNKGGVGARGYQLFRRGSVVITRWGSVTVGSNRSFSWAWEKPREKKYAYGSAERAIRRYQELVKHRVDVEGYDRLPTGAVIRRRSLST